MKCASMPQSWDTGVSVLFLHYVLSAPIFDVYVLKKFGFASLAMKIAFDFRDAPSTRGDGGSLATQIAAYLNPAKKHGYAIVHMFPTMLEKGLLETNVSVIPGIWIGSEDNARDWKGLLECGIRAILNVAKEVSSPFDSAPRALRSVSSTPNFRKLPQTDSTYYPPHLPSGRPGMHYLKLQWSHGQQDLVNNGFQAAMSFVDDALARGDGVLVHCQCGVSRSATMVIALVMRAAAERSRHVPPEVWALKGMQGAYSFVKEKSPCVGPNMSLIYQLLDYEKTLRGESGSPGSDDSFSKDEEWARRRASMDSEMSEEEADDDLENSVIMQEARALDKAMEDRIVARKASSSSIGSTGSGIGMGPAWRSRYASRKRTASIASYGTTNSVISEDLMEEDEDEHLLGLGGGFDSDQHVSGQNTESSASNSPDDEDEGANDIAPFAGTPQTARLAFAPPPSAPAWRTSFTPLPPPPATAVRKPAPAAIAPKAAAVSLPPPRPLNIRKRAESSKPLPPPLRLRESLLRRPSASSSFSSKSVEIAQTPSQTLFVFPPSPTLATKVQTPSTMTLTSEAAAEARQNIELHWSRFPPLRLPWASPKSTRGVTLGSLHDTRHLRFSTASVTVAKDTAFSSSFSPRREACKTYLLARIIRGVVVCTHLFPLLSNLGMDT
ncbi:hypothetical protein NMY22_g2579 [Coprinellus aureogranulatus]|nr:hypothetical protein NMY22_g2579 [Coprinellus aureogranulatus]